MSTRSPWIFRGVEDRMRVVVTGSQAYLGAATHQPLTASSMPVAGSGPFNAVQARSTKGPAHGDRPDHARRTDARASRAAVPTMPQHHR